MPTIKTKLIEGTKPEIETMSEIQKTMQLPSSAKINLMVFEIIYDQKKFYCCWSGGILQNGEPKLTLIGKAALEALMNLPIGNNESITFQELRLGGKPLRNKIKAILSKARAESKICFFGDMQGELDGHMASAFNLIDGTINISH